MSEAAAKAIWETWSASDLADPGQQKGNALSWAQLVKASESGKYPELAKLVDLARREAAAAIAAYEAERSCTT